MKNLFTTLVMLVIVFNITNAQIKNNKLKLPSDNNLTSLDPNLNLDKIKGHLKSGDYCYDAYVGTTAIIPPKTGGVRLVPIIGYLMTNKITEGYGQLVVEGLLKNSTYGYARGDSYTIYITPERGDTKKIDKNNIFISWVLSGERLGRFQLKNASVQYKPYGIVVIGNYEVNGILIGVNLSISPVACLI